MFLLQRGSKKCDKKAKNYSSTASNIKELNLFNSRTPELQLANPRLSNTAVALPLHQCARLHASSPAWTCARWLIFAGLMCIYRWTVVYRYLLPLYSYSVFIMCLVSVICVGNDFTSLWLFDITVLTLFNVASYKSQHRSVRFLI
jgi:hypothetical protein